MEEFRDRVYSLLLGMLRNKDEAEELTQEVLVKAQLNIKRIRKKDALSSWVYRIAINSAIDYLRRKKRKGVSLEDIPEPGFEPTIEEQISEEKMRWCIKNRIEQLPANYQAVIIMAELDGLKQKEIARLLSVPLSTVKMRLHRARRMLKSKVEEVCDVKKESGELFCIPKKESCC